LYLGPDLSGAGPSPPLLHSAGIVALQHSWGIRPFLEQIVAHTNDSC